ncbi:MAG: DASS family sodium-coupled anion symporter [Pseudomonadota bacterium]
MAIGGKNATDGPTNRKRSNAKLRLVGLIAGPLAAALLFALPAPEGLAPVAWRVAALTALMAIWWLSEAIPLAATALLPAIALPLLGVTGPRQAVVPYANPIILLFLGGFVLALTIERWGLHRRIAIRVISAMSARADRLIGGFMIATAGISMWVSNTATTMMMLPVALSVIAFLEQAEGKERAAMAGFPRAILLAIAYSASIGGVATLFGTPNAFLAGFLRQNYGIDIGFLQWMLYGVPVSATMLLLAWLLLARILFPGHRRPLGFLAPHLTQERAGLGPPSRGEWLSGALLSAVALAWIFRPILDDFIALSDWSIALIGAFLAFVIPIELKGPTFLMDWAHAKRLPWGILVLFGGGLSLAHGIEVSGLAEWLGRLLARGGAWPPIVFLLLLTAIVVFLTELTSNSATAAVLLPVAAALAIKLGGDPLSLAVPAALAAACAFMMPVATPPNVVVFGSGRITVMEMCGAGFALNLAAILVIVLFSVTLQPLVF